MLMLYLQLYTYFTGSRTATKHALQVAKEEFQRHRSDSRAKTLWILTDGYSNYGGNPVEAAQELKNMGKNTKKYSLH